MRFVTGVRELVFPRSLAVVGASPRNVEAVETVLRSRVKAWGVNPHRDEVAGLRCYPSVADLPEIPEAAFPGSARKRARQRGRSASGWRREPESSARPFSASSSRRFAGRRLSSTRSRAVPTRTSRWSASRWGARTQPHARRSLTRARSSAPAARSRRCSAATRRSRSRTSALSHTLVVADELQRVPLRVGEVQRADVQPSVFCRLNLEPQSFESPLLGVVIVKRDVEGNVM